MCNIVKMLELMTGDERVYGTRGTHEGILPSGVSKHPVRRHHSKSHCVAVYVLKRHSSRVDVMM
jgi:hypothetical protein